MIDFDEDILVHPGIKVIGVGKAGCRFADRVHESESEIDVVAIDTDAGDLKELGVSETILVGRPVTKGLGTGGNPEIGRKAIYQERNRVSKIAGCMDLVFLLCGLGGGTGTAFAPFMAEAAGSAGALTVAVVTKPFAYEGSRKLGHAEFGLKELRKICDCVIAAPNEKLVGTRNDEFSLQQGFEEVELAVLELITGIWKLLKREGILTVDFADIRRILEKSGDGVFGYGVAHGARRAEDAASLALGYPLMRDVDFSSGKSALVSIAASRNIKQDEIKAVVDTVARRAGGDIVAGVVSDPALKRKMKVVVVRAGIETGAGETTREDGAGYTGKAVYVKDTGDELDIPTFIRRRRKR